MNLYSINNIIQKTLSSVVSISGVKDISNISSEHDTLLDIMNNLNKKDQRSENIVEKIGSGVIIDKKNGYVVTNAHVVSDLDKINVMLKDNRILKAELIGIDYYSDLALIKINTNNIQDIKFGNSDNIKTGDFVVAIGNPYGFSHTVTSGIISALCRNNISLNTHGYYNFIQTDAAINQGNSGGALINMRGKLIGINTAMITTSQGGNMGLGLSIPVNMARIIISQLKSGGMKRGTLGVASQDITPNLSIGFHYLKKNGALISQVYPNTSAHKANLKTGDIITHLNEKVVIDSMHLRIMISLIKPEKNITLNIFRNNKYKTIRIKIKKKYPNLILGKEVFDGLGNSEFIEAKNNEFNINKGLIINKIDYDSPISETSLKKGDLIIATNKILTPSISSFKKASKKYKNILLLQVVRNKTKFFVVVKTKKI